MKPVLNPLRAQIESKMTEELGFNNIYDMFLHSTRKNPKKVLAMHKLGKGHWGSLMYDEVEKGSLDCAAAFLKNGIKKGDRVAFICNNRYEWLILDLALHRIGAVNISNYVTPDPKKLVETEICFNINDSQSRMIFVAEKYLDRVLEIFDEGKMPSVEKIVVLSDSADGKKVGDLETFPEFVKVGQKSRKLLEDYKEKVHLDDVATIIYTSGSTGLPKGVMLTHGNLISNAHNLASFIDLKETDVELSFLPLGHVFERIINYIILRISGTIGYAESIETIADDVQFVRPTVFPAVPRVFEKFKAKVEDNARSKGDLSYKIYKWSTKVGKEYSLGKKGFPMNIKYKIAKKIVFDKVVDKLGGHVRFFVSSSAPLSEDTAMFFKSMNLEILEAYGMTEAGPLISINKNGRARIGTVGEVPPEIEVRIADDGEILVRGPSIMKGYWNRPDADREAFLNGWLATGDIGVMSKDGYLKITDRKKNLIKTSTGKYVPPAPIEDRLVSNQYISQAIVIGEARPHCSAIIVPDFKRLEDYAQKNQLHYTSLDDLIKNQSVKTFYEDLIRNETKDMAAHEQPKKVILHSKEWTWETGELTPTQKVKRSVITKMFKDEIDRIYS